MKIFGLIIILSGPAAILGVGIYGYLLWQTEQWGGGYQMAAIGIWLIWGCLAVGYTALTSLLGFLLIIRSRKRNSANQAPEDPR